MAAKSNKKSKTSRLSKKNTVKNTTIEKAIKRETLFVVLALVAFIRILLTSIPSYEIDMGGYKAWSLYLANKGTKGLYETFHIVYAPAYLYLLWISGKIASIFPFAHEFFIKIWAVTSDILGGYFIYLIGKKHNKDKTGLILGVVYSLNPGVFFNSSIWGQFDSIPATLLLAALYNFDLKRKTTAIILFAIAILTKPQSGLLTPIVIILYFKDFYWNKLADWKQGIIASFSGILLYVISVIPFYYPTPLLHSNTSTGLKLIMYKIADLFYWMIYLYKESVVTIPMQQQMPLICGLFLEVSQLMILSLF